MAKATGVGDARTITLPVKETTAAVREALSAIKPLGQCSSKTVSTLAHITTTFRWDTSIADATADEVAAARAALAGLPGAGSIEVGPWGGRVVRRVTR